jgi:transcriptional antiterminator NusG
MENKLKWYVLRVVSGKEKKCKELIDKEVEKNPILNKSVKNVVLPLEKVYKVRKGKKYSQDRNFYPGYIIIEAYMDGEIMLTIEAIPDVIHFLKDGRNPIPLRPIEVNRMLNRVDENKDLTDYDVPFIIGENVEIGDGPFKSFNGEIVQIDNDKKTVKLNVKIFGRETPLELSFLQIDKI